MSLQPNLSPLAIGSKDAPHTLEFYYDIPCPFCQKSYKTFYNVLKPLVTTGALKDKVRIFIRLQPQPWHGASAFCHESIIAVCKFAPEGVLDYINGLFVNIEPWRDVNIADKTVRQIRGELCAVAASVIGQEKAKQVEDALALKGTPANVQLLNDYKYFIKLGRQNGIHVSPTVLWDGLVADQVSSSWGETEWSKFFSEKVTA